MTKYHVGIDLHKTVAQVCVRDTQGEIVAERRYALPDAEAGQAFVGYLSRWASEGRFAVEALGCNRWLVNACRARGYEMLVSHAAALGLKLEKRKTDRRDAQEIARRLYLGDLDRHARSYYATDAECGCRKLLRIRHRQVQRRQQTVNQIRSILNAYLLRPPQVVLTSRRSMAWLRQLELATPELTFTLQVLMDDLESLLAQIRKLDARIAQFRADEDVALLERELPQVAVQSAAVLRYELGDVRRFRRAREVAAYAGVVPSVSQSGEGKANHGPITKRGNRELRWTLTQWSVRLLATHPVVKTWARKQRRSMTKNKRRLALARRLLIGVWVMLTRGEVFSMERCLGLETA